jgi:hypothetical protein
VTAVKKYSWVLAIFICAIVGLTAMAQGYDKYLAPGDVEKATGLKGLTLVPRGSAAGAGGDLNFANAAGDLILMVQFADAKNFAGVKAKYGKAPVSGLGEQATTGASMPGMDDNMVAFTKGTHCVVLTAFGDFVNRKVYLTVDQLTAVARIVASRL